MHTWKKYIFDRASIQYIYIYIYINTIEFYHACCPLVVDALTQTSARISSVFDRRIKCRRTGRKLTAGVLYGHMYSSDALFESGVVSEGTCALIVFIRLFKSVVYKVNRLQRERLKIFTRKKDCSLFFCFLFLSRYEYIFLVNKRSTLRIKGSRQIYIYTRYECLLCVYYSPATL